MNFMFQRQLRTSSSEVYAIFTDENEDEDDIGRIDLHFTTQGHVAGLLVLEQERDDDEVMALLQTIDDDIVNTAALEDETFSVTVVTAGNIRTFGNKPEA